MISINNLSKREKSLAIITVSVVVAALFYAFLIIPLHQSWKDLNSQIRSKIDALDAGFRILANQKQLNEEHIKISKYAKFTKSDEEAIADAMAYIETVSRNDSCLITNIKPLGINKTDNVREILIDISTEANINQLSKFLYDIESSKDNLIKIKRLSISAKSGETDTLKGILLLSKILLN